MISILYVDDEPGLLELCRIFLEQTGEFRVDTVESGSEALTRLRDRHYDAIISDYQMPEMDGISLLKSIRRQAEDIPFILFTGRGREEVVIEAVNNGADFYLQKGGDPKAQFAELMHKVRQAVDKRRAEKKLHESEKRLTDIINFLPDATFAIDRGGKVIAWNRAIEEMTGVPAAEMLGRGDHEYAVPFYGHRRPILIDLIFEPEERIGEQYAGIRREKDVLVAETDLPRPLGKQLTLMGKASPLYDRQGEVAGAIESIRDITARKQDEDELRAAYEEISANKEELQNQYNKISRSEQVLRDSEEKYRTLVENSQDIIYIYHNDHILVINRRGPEVLGYSEDELKEMSIWDLVHPDDRKRVFEAGKGRLRGEDIPPHYTARIMTKSGKAIPMELVAVLATFQGEPAIMGIARDVTEHEEYIRGMARKTKTLTIINRIVQIASQNVELNVLLNTALVSIRDLLGFDAGGIYLIDEGTTRARIRCALDLVPEFILDADNIEIHDKPYDTVFIEGNPIISENYETLRPDRAKKYGFKSVASIPITAEQRVIGAINVVCTRRSEISADDREVLVTIGKELGSAIMRMKAEEALQESGEQYRTLIETTGTGYVILDDKGRVTDANAEYVRLTGHRDLAEIQGRCVTEWTSQPDFERNAAAVQECLRKGSIRNFDVDYVDGTGKITPVEVNATVVNNKGAVQIVTLCLDISGRRRSEAALRASEASISSILRAAPIGIGVVSDRVITHANERLCEMTGYTKDELVGRSARILYPTDEDYQFVGSEKYRQIQERGTGTVETRWITKGGSVRDILLSSTPVDSTSMTSNVTFTALDITERRKAEEARRQSENLYGTLADAAQDLIYIINKDDTVAYINAFAAKMAKKSRQDIIGRPRKDLFTGTEGARQYQNLQKVFSTGTPLSIESRVPMPSGDTWQNTHLIPLRHPDGAVTAILGISRDISSLKQVEEALRLSERKYRSIIDNVQDLIYQTDMEGKITMISPAGAKRAGFGSPEEMIGLDLAQTLYNDPQERKKFLGIIAREGSVNTYPLTLRDRKGHRYHVTASSHYYTDPDGHRLGFEGIVHDITHLKRTEDALKEANRKLNLLNSITRHDVANQLTVLQGYTQLAMVKDPDPMITDFLRKIDIVTATIARQIEFSKAYQELGVHAPGWFSLEEIFAKNKPKDILFSSSCTGTEVYADPMLEKVFANLFSNSIMHGERVSRITVRCEPSGEDLLITVEDNGVGIPLDIKQKIFKKGFGKNTGFGLFLAREILAITNILIHETGIHGKGARFEIIVPKSGSRFSSDAGNQNP
jgi:PAS domain S-box-containing protein